MRIPFRLVDVFTDRPLAGNQLCVVPEPLDLPAITPGRLTISQGQELGRPSTLTVDVEGRGDTWKVFVEGGVAPVGEGHFELPG